MVRVFKAVVVASALWMGALSLTGAARADSLADVLVAAYNNSNLLDQNRALLRAADEDLVQSVSRVLPVVRFVATALARHQQTTVGAVTTRTDTSSLSAQLTADMT